jgi:hypothetical protein
MEIHVAEDGYKLYISSLSKTITQDGVTLDVSIYRGEDEEWGLEVVNKHGTSIIWDDLFKDDAAAWAELERTISEEGIEALNTAA